MSKSHYRAFIFAFALFTALPAAAQSSHNYLCEDGTRLSVIFVNEPATDSRAVLRFTRPPSRLVLPQARSADGGRYSNDKAEFWIKGKGAMLTRAGKPQTTCRTR